MYGRLDPGRLEELAPYLKIGVTTKEEASSRLGPPRRVFANDTIWTYRMDHDGYTGAITLVDDGPNADSWKSVRYSLALVFNQDGILSDFNFVKVR
jgi:hypothetical protein